ncbi:MAG: hypothetical protein NTW19_08860 [Planctomycetota bacterium]|nr:hypothetical protein [Planctomycetota bacterium]
MLSDLFRAIFDPEIRYHVTVDILDGLEKSAKNQFEAFKRGVFWAAACGLAVVVAAAVCLILAQLINSPVAAMRLTLVGGLGAASVLFCAVLFVAISYALLPGPLRRYAEGVAARVSPVFGFGSILVAICLAFAAIQYLKLLPPAASPWPAFALWIPIPFIAVSIWMSPLGPRWKIAGIAEVVVPLFWLIPAIWLHSHPEKFLVDGSKPPKAIIQAINDLGPFDIDPENPGPLIDPITQTPLVALVRDKQGNIVRIVKYIEGMSTTPDGDVVKPFSISDKASVDAWLNQKRIELNEKRIEAIAIAASHDQQVKEANERVAANAAAQNQKLLDEKRRRNRIVRMATWVHSGQLPDPSSASTLLIALDGQKAIDNALGDEINDRLASALPDWHVSRATPAAVTDGLVAMLSENASLRDDAVDLPKYFRRVIVARKSVSTKQSAAMPGTTSAKCTLTLDVFNLESANRAPRIETVGDALATNDEEAVDRATKKAYAGINNDQLKAIP